MLPLGMSLASPPLQRIVPRTPNDHFGIPPTQAVASWRSAAACLTCSTLMIRSLQKSSGTRVGHSTFSIATVSLSGKFWRKKFPPKFPKTRPRVKPGSAVIKGPTGSTDAADVAHQFHHSPVRNVWSGSPVPSVTCR